MATHNSDNGYVVTAISARQPPPAARPSPSLVFILYTHTASRFRTFATVTQRAPTVLRTSRLNSKSRFLFTQKTTVALSLFTIIKTTCSQIYFLFLFSIHYLLPISLVIRSTWPLLKFKLDQQLIAVLVTYDLKSEQGNGSVHQHDVRHNITNIMKMVPRRWRVCVGVRLGFRYFKVHINAQSKNK